MTSRRPHRIPGDERPGWPGPVPVLATAACCAALSACESGAGTPEATVRDSAGVEIVANPAGAVEAAPEWTLGPEPELDIGVVEGDSLYQLDAVGGAARLSDGAVAVADGGSSEVRVYGPDGRFRRAMGGPGEGPGEFQRLSGLHLLPADSVLAFDSRQSRASVFDPDGGFVRSIPLEVATGRRASLVDRLSDGTLILSEINLITDVPGTGVHQYPQSLFLRSAGGSTDSLTSLPGRAFHLQQMGGGIRITQLPFAGGSHAAGSRGRIYVGHGDRFTIRSYDPDGTLQRSIRLSLPPRPVTEEDVARMVEARTEDAHDQEEARDIRQRLEVMELPETMPAFEDLTADEAGKLWVREYAPPGVDANDWIVFGPEGRVRATVELPPRFEPLEIGQDYVLGRWRDELDVEHVRMYHLVKEGDGEA